MSPLPDEHNLTGLGDRQDVDPVGGIDQEERDLDAGARRALARTTHMEHEMASECLVAKFLPGLRCHWRSSRPFWLWRAMAVAATSLPASAANDTWPLPN